MSRPPLGSTLDVLGLSIPFYSLLMMLAVILGYVLTSREAKRRGFPEDAVTNYALLAIPMGIVGARLYYVVFQWEEYRGDLWEIFRIWNGGLAIYGAILGGAAAAVIFYRKKPKLLLELLDSLAPSVALGQAIGRWGNYANMEAFGRPVSNPAFQFFPIAVEIPQGGEWVWHIASFFYESVLCFLIFLFLYRMRTRHKKSGDALLWYMFLYGACRVFTESLRTDSLTFELFGLTLRVSQLLSALLCLTAAVIFFLRSRSRSSALCFSVIFTGLAALLLASDDAGLFSPACVLLLLCVLSSLLFWRFSDEKSLSLFLFTLPGGILSVFGLLFPSDPAFFSILLQLSVLLFLPAAMQKLNHLSF